MAVTCLRSPSSDVVGTGARDSQTRALCPEPSEVAHSHPQTPLPSLEWLEWWTQVSLTLPDKADVLGRLPRAERCTVIACDDIVETPLGGVK